jgi:hypothetical protein
MPTKKEPAATPEGPPATPKERREIPGGFPYTASPGVLAKALARIPICERPAQFSHDFLSTVIGVTGGSARVIIPILKRVGLLNSDGTPSERYAHFQTQTKRANAALEALKTGWPELFRKNRYADRLEKGEIEELFVEVTGLKKADPVFRAITSTYNVFREYAKGATDAPDSSDSAPQPQSDAGFEPQGAADAPGPFKLGLTNQINIILPETTDINVYNSIFKALRENLLR